MNAPAPVAAWPGVAAPGWRLLHRRRHQPRPGRMVPAEQEDEPVPEAEAEAQEADR